MGTSCLAGKGEKTNDLLRLFAHSENCKQNWQSDGIALCQPVYMVAEHETLNGCTLRWRETGLKNTSHVLKDSCEPTT